MGGFGALFAPGFKGWGFREPVVLQNPERTVFLSGRSAGWHELLDKIERATGEGKWVVGYFGYECFKYFLGFSPRRRSEVELCPPAAFMFFGSDPRPYRTPPNPHPHPPSTGPAPNMSRARFLSMVEEIKRHIAAGDVYQVNISQRFDVQTGADADQIFHRLCSVQPAPFACMLDFGDFQIVSGSMELFLRKRGRSLVSRPIKGTRPRGPTPHEGRRLRKALKESEKERAENVMIVDLMRNDLGRICEFGSISVPKLFEVEEYSTLYQMVSEVRGILRARAGLADILQAAFPPGSVTGAPKIRAMEIIDELEPHSRGPYCGVITLFRPDGDFDMSVAIRVLVLSEGEGRFWVGGGITWGSDPRAEYEETIVKARALMGALGCEPWSFS